MERRYLRALIAVALACTGAVASSSRPALATDLDAVRARAQEVADRVSHLEGRLARLGSQRTRLASEIESTSARVVRTETERREAEDAYLAAQDAFVEDAIEVYKQGPRSADLALVLSAQDLSDMELFSKIASAAGDEAARSLEETHALLESALRARTSLEDGKRDLLARSRRLDVVTARIEADLAERREMLHDLQNEIATLEEAARSAASSGGVSPTGSFAAALQPTGPTADIPAGLVSTGVSFEGTASWYGPGFEGNYTANGDVFDSSLYTAASKELPLPSYLLVTHEGRSVVVLVNDRGPYVGDRILDLSHAAAEAIGISGLGWISAEILVRSDR